MHRPEATGDYAAQVIENFVRTGIDPSRCVVIGSSSMALSGLRPASDLDVIPHPDAFDLMMEAGQTPGGIPLAAVEAGSHWKRLISDPDPDEGYLRIDVKSRWGRGRGPYFAKLLESSEERLLPGGTLRVITLETLLEQKSLNPRPKDTRDAALIRGHLGRQAAAAV